MNQDLFHGSFFFSGRQKSKIFGVYHTYAISTVKLSKRATNLDKFPAKHSVTGRVTITEWRVHLVVHVTHPLLIKAWLIQFIFHRIPPILHGTNDNPQLEANKKTKKNPKTTGFMISCLNLHSYYLKNHLRVCKLLQCIHKGFHSSSLIQHAPEPVDTHTSTQKTIGINLEYLFLPL